LTVHESLLFLEACVITQDSCGILTASTSTCESFLNNYKNGNNRSRYRDWTLSPKYAPKAASWSNSEATSDREKPERVVLCGADQSLQQFRESSPYN